MFDLRPVGYVIGMLVALMGTTMIFPLIVDLYDGNPHWRAFAESGIITVLFGSLMAIATSNGKHVGLDIQKTFLLTASLWVALPFFGALPFVLGATKASVVDAFFESVSGMTTTGSTVLSGLDFLPRGLLLWRGILQWLGGVGIIVVALAFLPELRVGGMQVFRAEGFDTMGKILPRATEIAGQISGIYIFLTLICFLSFLAVGLNSFDALVHAFTTISTGGFSNYDASFGTFSGPPEYVASFFMILAALPFVRFVQMVNGNFSVLTKDSQVIVFIALIGILVIGTTFVLVSIFPHHYEQAFREALFNIVSILSGTGYASVDYMEWGGFLIAMFFFIGLIGGCAGSTACSVKIFRYQIMVASIRNQLKKIHSPNGVFIPKFQGRPIGEDVMASVMSFFVVFFVTLGILAVLLGMTGLDFVTALSGAATAVANIGPGLGDQIGPAGNFAGLNDTAKWLLIVGMLLGRLELMTVYILFTPRFWRN
jgi:trk system potassium uptake protein TrkH